MTALLADSFGAHARARALRMIALCGYRVRLESFLFVVTTLGRNSVAVATFHMHM